MQFLIGENGKNSRFPNAPARRQNINLTEFINFFCNLIEQNYCSENSNIRRLATFENWTIFKDWSLEKQIFFVYFVYFFFFLVFSFKTFCIFLLIYFRTKNQIRFSKMFLYYIFFNYTSFSSISLVWNSSTRPRNVFL